MKSSLFLTRFLALTIIIFATNNKKGVPVSDSTNDSFVTVSTLNSVLNAALRDQTEQICEIISDFYSRVDERFNKVEADIADLKNDVAILKKDVSLLKDDVAILKKDVSLLKDDVAILKKDVSSLKKTTTNIDDKLAEVAMNNLERDSRLRRHHHWHQQTAKHLGLKLR
jgi:septal ring factor EnvC (AmiA/AmiB activator)